MRLWSGRNSTKLVRPVLYCLQTSFIATTILPISKHHKMMPSPCCALRCLSATPMTGFMRDAVQKTPSFKVRPQTHRFSRRFVAVWHEHGDSLHPCVALPRHSAAPKSSATNEIMERTKQYKIGQTKFVLKQSSSVASTTLPNSKLRKVGRTCFPKFGIMVVPCMPSGGHATKEKYLPRSPARPENPASHGQTSKPEVFWTAWSGYSSKLARMLVHPSTRLEINAESCAKPAASHSAIQLMSFSWFVGMDSSRCTICAALDRSQSLVAETET